MLRRCFPLHVRLVGTVMLALSPQTFRRELALIARLGATTNDSSVKPELEGYAYENQRDKSFRVRTLGLRLSRRKFIRMLHELRARGEGEGEQVRGAGGSGGKAGSGARSKPEKTTTATAPQAG